MNEKNKFNIFISILRMYLSFSVVCTHLFYPKRNNFNNKYIIKLLKHSMHVPIFYIMSFYLCYNLFLMKNLKKIKERFERLIIPFFIWPLVILIFNNIFNFKLNLKLKNSFNDLIIQYITGCNFQAVLWFQYNLIFSTLLMIIIEFSFYKKVRFILINILIIAFFIQYSNYNFIIFSRYKYSIKYCFGRFFEIIPYCITGYFLSSFYIMKYLKIYNLKSIYLLLLNIILFSKYYILNYPQGFGYQGIKLYIISVNIFIIFNLLPSEKIKNIFLIKIIKIITKYTSIVYYLHNPISIYLKYYIN